MDSEICIIGGGVAGLSAAIRLAELGKRPLLIDAGSYPSHKVCGEFFSPECLPILDRWDVKPKTSIHEIIIKSGKKQLVLPLKQPAGSASRYHFDHSLAQKAESVGVQLLTNTRVKSLNPIVLESGETIHTRHLIIGAGRLIHPKSEPKYIGFKTNLSDIQLDRLEMHLLPGAYYGISPIGNVACLAKPGCMSEERLNSLLGVEADWLTVRAPAFGLKTLPHWENCYFVGDAAGTIPPASGNGLAMGITSGVMCAEHVIRGDWQGFRKAWQKRYTSRIRWARFLHQLMLHPSIAYLGAYMPELLFHKTRQ